MTEQLSNTTGNGSMVEIKPSLAAGWSKLGLFVGLGVLAVGHLVDIPAVVWGGVTLVALALGLNTVAKVGHYWGLGIPRRDRLLLSASWLVLAVTVLGVIANYAYAQYGPGDGSFFWSLAVAGLGFGLLHMAAQSIYLEGVAETD